MESRVALANERHRRGYNCAQAVACTYADLVGVDEETLFRATEGLGLGMGCMEGTCGALSGACVLAGLKGSDPTLDHPHTKAQTYQVSRQLVDRFQAEVGATRCGTIKGRETGQVLLPCDQCVMRAAKIVEQVLFAGE